MGPTKELRKEPKTAQSYVYTHHSNRSNTTLSCVVLFLCLVSLAATCGRYNIALMTIPLHTLALTLALDLLHLL